jgi:WD40 repeat protein
MEARLPPCGKSKMKTGKVRFAVNDDKTDIKRLDFSPDGKLLAIAYGNGTVKVWSLDKVLEKKPSKQPRA